MKRSFNAIFSILVSLLTLTTFFYLFVDLNSKENNYNNNSSLIHSTSIISRNAPVWVSSSNVSLERETRANDSSYNTAWRSGKPVSSSTPAWIAYDLSGVSPSLKNNVVSVFYNDLYEDYDFVGYTTAYNNPADYVIKVSSSSGGVKPPSLNDISWKSVVNVKGNTYHSRQSVFNMRQENWVMLEVSKTNGSDQNMDVSLNWDIFSLQNQNLNSIDNDFIFYGDSITAYGMSHCSLTGNFNTDCTQAAGGVPAFQTLISNELTGNDVSALPIEENGAIAGTDSGTAVADINKWLKVFPGKYVALDYGTNDLCSSRLEVNYNYLIPKLISIGKIPIIPTIPWSRNSYRIGCAQMQNKVINSLYQKYPHIIKGPDFYTYFSLHPDQIAVDDIHPTAKGYQIYRQLWAYTILENVYEKKLLPIVVAVPK